MDEKMCGDCKSFLPEKLRQELQGWGLCESTGRIMHESTLCTDCDDFVRSDCAEDMGGR